LNSSTRRRAGGVSIIEPSDRVHDILNNPWVALDVPKPNASLGIFGEHLPQEVDEKVVDFFISQIVVVTVRVHILPLIEGCCGWRS
jgi:hypothetical protein